MNSQKMKTWRYKDCTLAGHQINGFNLKISCLSQCTWKFNSLEGWQDLLKLILLQRSSTVFILFLIKPSIIEIPSMHKSGIFTEIFPIWGYNFILSIWGQEGPVRSSSLTCIIKSAASSSAQCCWLKYSICIAAELTNEKRQDKDV